MAGDSLAERKTHIVQDETRIPTEIKCPSLDRSFTQKAVNVDLVSNTPMSAERTSGFFCSILVDLEGNLGLLRHLKGTRGSDQ
jgi:hypothetical protein